MVAGKHRSRTYRRVFRKTPGGKTVKMFKKRKPSKSKCTVCKKPLQGVSRERPYKTRRLSKTQRRPERPFGGMLCSACARKRIIEKIHK